MLGSQLEVADLSIVGVRPKPEGIDERLSFRSGPRHPITVDVIMPTTLRSSTIIDNGG